MTKFDDFADWPKSAKNECFFGSPGSSKNGSRMRAMGLFDVDAIGAMKLCCVETCVKVCRRLKKCKP